MTYLMRTYRSREKFLFRAASEYPGSISTRRACDCPWKPFLRNFIPFNELLANKEPFKHVIAVLSKMCCAIVWNWLSLSFIASPSGEHWTCTAPSNAILSYTMYRSYNALRTTADWLRLMRFQLLDVSYSSVERGERHLVATTLQPNYIFSQRRSFAHIKEKNNKNLFAWSAKCVQLVRKWYFLWGFRTFAGVRTDWIRCVCLFFLSFFRFVHHECSNPVAIYSIAHLLPKLQSLAAAAQITPAAP